VTELINTRHDLREVLAPARRNEGRIGLVPTMGALHAGHLSLVEMARTQCDVVVVSIFVNPLQFNDPSDFTRYPRDLDSDVTKAQDVGVDVVFAPSTDEMYPHTKQDVVVDPGTIGAILEGAARPGHFRGVATVVTKLFGCVAPDLAVFGEKDYQQLTIIRRIVEDLALPIAICSSPTVREVDGLAISSRNRLLSHDERDVAVVLYKALKAGAEMIASGIVSVREVETALALIISDESLIHIDYATVRDADSLESLEECAGSMRILVAACLGKTRLIDNVGVTR
jgi:pantoate--beta-alanine ligase